MPYQHVREPFTNEEADRLANACETTTERLIVSTLLDTGLRVGELCDLTTKDVLWQQRQLRVRGKGGPFGKKSKVRVMPMSRRVRALLEQHFALHKEFPVRPRRAQGLVKEATNRAGLIKDVTPRVPGIPSPRPPCGRASAWPPGKRSLATTGSRPPPSTSTSPTPTSRRRSSGLGPLLKGKLRERRVRDQWDNPPRVAGSLKQGHVTASLLIGKRQASPRPNALTRALREYGRVAKTLLVPRSLGSEAYRRRIGAQGNKGESLHALRRFLFFAHQRRVRRGQPEDQANQASCLNLVANAVIAWNTVYLTAVIDRLKARGERIAPEDLVHFVPARYDHINPHGHYQFRVDRWAGKKPLRPIKV